MIFDISNIVVGIALLVVAYLIYLNASGRGTRRTVILVAIIGLIGLYLILVRGLGLISLG